MAFHAIEHRAKAVASVAEKLTRPSKAYKNGLADITDLCGLRVITYTLSDVERVCALLGRELALSAQHTVDKATLLAPSEFGYRSRHFVVQLSGTRNALSEWKRFAGIQAEIQVRTVLEHAWAAIDHSLRYKRDADVPREQKRALFRLSALLEMADENFDSLKKEQAELRRDAIRRLETSSEESPELDSISYPLYAQSSETLQELMQIALACGFSPSEDDGAQDSSVNTESELISYAKDLGIRTIREIDTTLRAEKAGAEGYFAALIEAKQGTGPKVDPGWLVSPNFVALLCIIRRNATITADHLVNRSGWHRSVAERVVSVAAADRAGKSART